MHNTFHRTYRSILRLFPTTLPSAHATLGDTNLQTTKSGWPERLYAESCSPALTRICLADASSVDDRMIYHTCWTRLRPRTSIFTAQLTLSPRRPVSIHIYVRLSHLSHPVSVRKAVGLSRSVPVPGGGWHINHAQKWRSHLCCRKAVAKGGDVQHSAVRHVQCRKTDVPLTPSRLSATLFTLYCTHTNRSRRPDFGALITHTLHGHCAW